MGLYRNTKPHAVYVAGWLIAPGEAREVPDNLIPLDQETVVRPEPMTLDSSPRREAPDDAINPPIDPPPGAGKKK